MPKRSISGQAGPGSETVTRPIGTLVAAGLSLAVIGFATQFGVLTVSAAVLLAPMVYVFARLRGHAPDARTTSDFVAPSWASASVCSPAWFSSSPTCC